MNRPVRTASSTSALFDDRAENYLPSSGHFNYCRFGSGLICAAPGAGRIGWSRYPV
jgi:hypothetical protein